MLLEMSNLEVTVSTNEIAHTVRIPSLAVDQGQMAILLGPSGSGKSVLLKTLSNDFSNTEVDVKGEVTINEKNGNSIRLCDGVNVSETGDRPVVFYVFQDPRSYLHPRLTLREYGTLLEHRLPTVENVGELFEDSVAKISLQSSLIKSQLILPHSQISFCLQQHFLRVTISLTVTAKCPYK